MSEKIYLDIPYAIKNEAKALGAKYDPDVKKFYIDNVLNIKDFENVYLKVPYDDRLIAKEQGCLFDRSKKCWYTPTYNYNKNSILSRYEIIA